MKMKTKCSFYLPVEFPLTAPLTRESRINSWLAAENRFWLFSSRCKRKSVILWSLSGNLHYTRPVIYVYAGQLGALLILGPICGLSVERSQIICLWGWKIFHVHSFYSFYRDPYLGTFSPDYFIHSGFLRKYYIKWYLSGPLWVKKTLPRPCWAWQGRLQAPPQAPEGSSAFFVSCCCPSNWAETTATRRGNGASPAMQTPRSVFLLHPRAAGIKENAFY